MASVGKEVILKNTPGQLVQKESSDHVVTVTKKDTLDEDSFTENISQIIRRDFFPDLPKLEMQLEYIKASKEQDYARMRELSERLAETTRTPSTRDLTTPSARVTDTPSYSEESRKRSSAQQSDEDTTDESSRAKQTKNPSDFSLDEYLSKYHSEDDASYNELAEKALEKHRMKYSWLYKQEQEVNQQLAIEYSSSDGQGGSGLLALTDGSEKESTGDSSSQELVPKGRLQNKLQVETWSYKAKNSLMYVPEGVEMSLKERMEAGITQKEIVHSNTRLSMEFLAQLNDFDPKSGDSDHKPTGHKVGVDGKVLEGEDEPSVNGYGFVSTPVIQPGVDASPLMTWGTVEGTPLRLDGGTTPSHSGGPSFKMPKAPKREQIGVKLAVKASKAYTERKKKALETATTSLLKSSPSIQNALRIPTPNDKLKLLSPAARKLAQKTTPIRSVDHSLRRSYTPSHTPSSSPLMTAKSGGRKKSAGSCPSSSLRSSSGSSTPTPSLLSDNLLNLTN